MFREVDFWQRRKRAAVTFASISPSQLSAKIPLDVELGEIAVACHMDRTNHGDSPYCLPRQIEVWVRFTPKL